MAQKQLTFYELDLGLNHVVRGLFQCRAHMGTTMHCTAFRLSHMWCTHGAVLTVCGAWSQGQTMWRLVLLEHTHIGAGTGEEHSPCL